MVLDEADRMFDFGFEPQISSILRSTRLDRQTCLFSATFPSHIEGKKRRRKVGGFLGELRNLLEFAPSLCCVSSVRVQRLRDAFCTNPLKSSLARRVELPRRFSNTSKC